MWAIVGLGNPGREYARTRHNVGFMVVDLLAARHGIDLSRSLHHSVYGRGRIDGESVCLHKPMTYMNRSGIAVVEALSWWKEPLTSLLVVLDEATLPLGALRIRAQGSAGSHNGLASVVDRVGDTNFTRIRLGVGTPIMERMNLADFVLGRFPEDEWPEVEEMVETASEAVAYCLTNEVDKAIQKYNRRGRSGQAADPGS